MPCIASVEMTWFEIDAVEEGKPRQLRWLTATPAGGGDAMRVVSAHTALVFRGVVWAISGRWIGFPTILSAGRGRSSLRR